MSYLSTLSTLLSLTLHCHIHPLQAANCCRNSRLVVDEEDLMGWQIKNNILLLLEWFLENFLFKPSMCRK